MSKTRLDPALWEECDGSSISLAYLYRELASTLEQDIRNGQFDELAREMFGPFTQEDDQNED